MCDEPEKEEGKIFEAARDIIKKAKKANTTAKSTPPPTPEPKDKTNE